MKITFKRVLLLALILLIVIYSSMYFFGGYAPASATNDTREFDDTGFTTYVDYEQELLDKIENEDPFLGKDSPSEKFQAIRHKTDAAKLKTEFEDIKTQLELDYAEATTQTQKDEINEDINLYGGLINDIVAELPNLPSAKDYQEIAKNEFVPTLSNSNYSLDFNYTNTNFKLYDIANGKEYYSNPQEPDPSGISASKTVANEQKSLLKVSVIGSRGVTTGLNTYEYSVSQGTNDEPLIPNFATKVNSTDGTIQIKYVLQERGISIADFPRMLTEERVNELVLRNHQLVDSGVLTEDDRISETSFAFKKLFGTSEHSIYLLKDRLDENGNVMLDDAGNPMKYYELSKYRADTKPEKPTQEEQDYYDAKYPLASGTHKADLDKFFNKNVQYTIEDFTEDNLEFNIEVPHSKTSIEVVLELKLTDNGLTTTVLRNGIKENETDKIAFIDILPYFGASTINDEGYTLIPDGSGAIIDYNNGKSDYARYVKRVYTEDMAKLQTIKKTETADILLPIFATMNQTGVSGLLAEGVKGAAQLQITSDISGRLDGYNRTFFTAFLRESDTVTIGTGASSTKTIMWTDAAITTDIELEFNTLASDELTYDKVAKKYRDIIIERNNITLKDTTDKAVINAEIIGAYTFKTNFLGVNYTAHGSMTSFEEAQTVIKSIYDQGIDYVNVFYKGWREEGLTEESFENMDFSNKLGNKKDLNNLVTYLEEQNAGFYPTVDAYQINEYQKAFGNNHFTSRNVVRDFSIRHEFVTATFIEDLEKKPTYIVSPKFYNKFVEIIVKNYEKSMDQDSILLDSLGSSLAGDYRKYAELFKNDAVIEQIKAYETLANSNIKNIAGVTPYDYAFKYLNVATEVPYETTGYEILDYSVPFYQLVVNQMFDYSGMIINANNEKGYNYHMMHMIETGSNPSFTLTYDDSVELKQTDYNNYFYTYYENWLEDIKNYSSELNGLNIFNKELTGHEELSISVYKVTYTGSNNETVEIILNYSDTPYNHSGITVNPRNYKVV